MTRPGSAIPRNAGSTSLIDVATNGAVCPLSLSLSSPPLKDIHWLDVMTAIVKVAGKPIKYSIEDYAVVFSARTGREPRPLYVRTLRLTRINFYQGLENC